MSSAAKVLNVGREVTLGGKTYRVREMDEERLFRLAQWLQDRAFEAVDRQPVSDDEKRECRRDLVGDIAAGRYDPGGDVFARLSVTLSGVAKGLFIALSDDYPEVTQEQCTAWTREHATAAARAAVEAFGDPKASSPGASAPGGSATRGSGTSTRGRSKKSKGSRRGR